MYVVMAQGSTDEEIDGVREALERLGLTVRRETTGIYTRLTAANEEQDANVTSIRELPGVLEVGCVQPHLPSRRHQPADTVLTVGKATIGGLDLAVFAGPCSVEDEETAFAIAGRVRRAGAIGLRGGAFKPRSSPYSFQGLGKRALATLRRAADENGLLVLTEVLDTRDVEMTAQYADILQIGSRNMENTPLLREVGRGKRPVLLKRGRSSTVEEWLLAAEYIMLEGNRQVILCERGIRTFEGATRNTLDISSIPLVKAVSHLPVIADPSHGTGRRDMVIPMCRAAVAAGADGLLVEVHPQPVQTLCDGRQSILPEQFDRLMSEVAAIAQAIGRTCRQFQPAET